MKYLELDMLESNNKFKTDSYFTLGGFMHPLLELEVKPGSWSIFTHSLKEDRYIQSINNYKTLDNLKLLQFVHPSVKRSDINSFETTCVYNSEILDRPFIVINNKLDYDTHFMHHMRQKVKNLEFNDLLLNMDDILICTFRGDCIVYYKTNLNGEIVEILVELCPVYVSHELSLGTFEISSDEVVISDPCYDLDTWCSSILTDVKKGIWEGRIKREYISCFYYNTELLATLNSDLKSEDIQELLDICVGVDSGQAGIYDKSVYRNNNKIVNKKEGFKISVGHCAGDLWYSYVCETTLSKLHAGVLIGGVASTSGYGDGGYNCYCHRDVDGKIDGLRIVFIGDSEETDEEEFEDLEI